MSLKTVFQAMKKEGYIVKQLDLYLLKMQGEDNDRAINVNAPSQAGKCLRARYYARTQTPSDGFIEPRTQRIFDNGTKTHERLQHYLLKMGMLLMDEVPIHNEEYNIQGHTDGVLCLDFPEPGFEDGEKGVLEIKSINSRGFAELKDAKPEHKVQGLIYIYGLEERRKYLRSKYKTEKEFKKSYFQRMKEYASLYQHLKDGSKHTREEKIRFQCGLHTKMDSILFHTDKPITKAIFLYENKDTQDLKEFVVSSLESGSKDILNNTLSEFSFLNECVESGTLPDRCTRNKNDCRFCDYKVECWN